MSGTHLAADITGISWASSNTEVIANDGKFTMPAVDTEVTLTATITKGEITKVVTIKVTAKYVDPNAATPIKFDFGTNEEFLAWTNSYIEHELVYEDVTVKFGRANRQTSNVTDAPVLAGNASSAPTVYMTLTGNLSKVKYARVVTKEWNSGATAKYVDIHLEYTTDGETWTTCSNVATAPGTIESTEMSNVLAIRLSFTVGGSGNTQLPIVSVEISPSQLPVE